MKKYYIHYTESKNESTMKIFLDLQESMMMLLRILAAGSSNIVKDLQIFQLNPGYAFRSESKQYIRPQTSNVKIRLLPLALS